MAATNPPPSPLLLRSFGKNAEQIRDIEELRQFLFFIWDRLGGPSDLVLESVSSVEGASSRKSYKVSQLEQDLDRIRAHTRTSERKICDLGHEINSLKAELKTERMKTRKLEQRLNQFIASIETNG